MFRILITILFIILNVSAYAQPEILEQYVNEGLKNNLALKQQHFSLEKSLQALKEARGMFLPAISVEARYSRAGGGRMIDIPSGDFMNLTFGILNDKLSAAGMQPDFPTNFENQQVPFLREEEHDTKIRITQPIFQPAIFFNYKIKANIRNMEKAQIEIFRQELICDIKTAYYNYLKTTQVVKLFERTKKLLNENLRISEKLFQNDKKTEDVVFQAKAELSRLEQQHTEALKNERLAAAYFNFLINKELKSEITFIEYSKPTLNEKITLDEAICVALKNRKEFNKVQEAVSISKNQARINSSKFLPGVTGVFDYGYQGEKYKFTNKNDYWMASVVLQWNLFNGFQDRCKQNQALLEKKKYEAQFSELQNKIRLQVQEAYDNLLVARKSIVSAKDQLNSVKKSFRIISKKYKLGIAPQIEYLNARNQFTNAEINKIIVQYDYFIKDAILNKTMNNNQ